VRRYGRQFLDDSPVPTPTHAGKATGGAPAGSTAVGKGGKGRSKGGLRKRKGAGPPPITAAHEDAAADGSSDPAATPAAPVLLGDAGELEPSADEGDEEDEGEEVVSGTGMEGGGEGAAGFGADGGVAADGTAMHGVAGSGLLRTRSYMAGPGPLGQTRRGAIKAWPRGVNVRDFAYFLAVRATRV
jgi:hypothetical protein